MQQAAAKQPSLAPDPSRSLLVQRLERLDAIRRNPAAQRFELELCKRNKLHWFDWWVWTYDPRLSAERDANGRAKPALIPFNLFPRQRQLLTFLETRIRHRDDGLVEKSRDFGWTWQIGGWALHHWLWTPGFKTSYGSYLEKYVDKKGDPDAFFERVRMILRNLPTWMLPAGFSDAHDNYMRLVNPENSNTITGAVGDNMGRAGRSTVQVIDEAAFLEHGDKVEASTSSTSDVRLWASTVNGMGNIFARKRFGGSLRPDQIFVLDYRDDPRKTAEWVAKKKAQLEPQVWAAEYERDYSASVEGICIPAKWVQSAVELGDLFRAGGVKDPANSQPMSIEPSLDGVVGLDVGAGKAKSVKIGRFGAIVLAPEASMNPDTIDTAHWALDTCKTLRMARLDQREARVRTLCFDSVGVGAGVQAALKHHQVHSLTINPVNVGIEPTDTMWPDGQRSAEKFANLKAELWWVARARFKASHELLLYLRGEKDGQKHPLDEVLVLPSLTTGPDVQILVGQLSLPKVLRNERGKLIMESKVQLASRDIPSPDHAEAFILTFATSRTIDVWRRLGGAA